jgi:hypothetical protein
MTKTLASFLVFFTVEPIRHGTEGLDLLPISLQEARRITAV